MKNFKWLLNLSLENINTADGDVIPVFRAWDKIGNCTIQIKDGQIIGHFLLHDDLDSAEYVLYVVTIPEASGQRWLAAISLIGPANNRVKAAKQAKDMQII